MNILKCLLFLILFQLTVYSQNNSVNNDKQITLDLFKNQRLLDLNVNSKKQLNSLLLNILPKNKNLQRLNEFIPWYIWKIDNLEGNSKYILFEAQHLYSIPGQSSTRIVLFDKNG